MTSSFLRRAQTAIEDPDLQQALDNNAARRKRGMEESFSKLPNYQALRERAHRIRLETIQNLPELLEVFIGRLQEKGFTVHLAEDSKNAQQIILKLVEAAGGKTVAKSKSMVTEEIHLNEALQSRGIHVVETDLGEFIVQLRGESPGHIITPAIHLLRQDVAETFQQHLGMDYTTDVEVMNRTARSRLRQIFLHAEVGISGVNFGVVETGSLVLVTNEGNGRMVTSLPPVHIAVMGMERLLPTLEDLAVMLQLLPRSATGQKLTSYVSLIQSVRNPGEPDGARERHVVIVDNGRRDMIESPLSESLLCIRCGACLNVCPVFREAGGHAYGSVYPGPIGSLVSPGLFGLKEFGSLAKASTLCGACADVCPVKIDFPTLLLQARRQYAEETRRPTALWWGMRIFSWLTVSPTRFRLAQRLGEWAVRYLPKREGWLHRLPWPFSLWNRSRDFPPFSFRAKETQRTRPISSGPDSSLMQIPLADEKPPSPPSDGGAIGATEIFLNELEDLGGGWKRCTQRQISEMVKSILGGSSDKRVLIWEVEEQPLLALREELGEAGYECMDAEIPVKTGTERTDRLEQLDEVKWGITGAIAALADTGSLVIPSGPGKSGMTSLLPEVHIALLSASQIYPDMVSWFRSQQGRRIREFSNLQLISGPSRTADIEMTLTIGVHGPAEVWVVLYD